VAEATIIAVVACLIFGWVWLGRRADRIYGPYPRPETSAEEDLESWLRCVQVEYAAGDITVDELEHEVERYLRAYHAPELERPLSFETPKLDRIMR
jgi:hypothetical protein